ncbi:MAG: DNA repair protein RecN, partial [Leptolyngbyaceae bacterium]|nr:DNA repair protein RecN [Leptolyngbyaceae bacterium]
MLLSLHIENFALIDSLDLSLGDGLNVLTGETGAGKSIILDALDAALGGKVPGRVVRVGAEKGVVEAHFEMNPQIREWLAHHEIDEEDDALICARELMVGRGGLRSRSRVNGVLVNKQQIESLRDRLVEITAQGQTVQLGQSTVQRDWLDGFGGDPQLQQRQAVATAYERFQAAAKTLEQRKKTEQERLQQMDLFAFQEKELRDANLTDADELEALEQERKRLSHAVELQQQSYEVYQALYQDESGNACADLLGRAEQVLENMVEYDPDLQSILDMVSGALAQVEQAGREINAYGENLETDPEQLDQIEARIRQLKNICRKYGPTLADAIALSQELQAQMEGFSDSSQSLEALEEAYAKRKSELEKACAQLTDIRLASAQKLESLLLQELKPLAMEKVQFKVDVSPIAPSASGADRITFLLSPNPGEPLQPLAETASGGEMSRFLLALKVCLSQADAVGTMVFDEIDVGVSGRVAQAIAEKLHLLGLHHQVLCVTHQPLVAAMAHTHFHVEKEVVGTNNGSVSNDASDSEASDSDPLDDVRTVVRISLLDDDARRAELAQLAGGKTDQEAIAFATSLLSQAKTR